MILGCSRDDRFGLKGLTHDVLHLIGLFNMANYVPWTSLFDLQELRRQFKKISKAFDQVFEQITNNHENPFDGDKKNIHSENFVDILYSHIHKPMD
ncbi:hypothetical protein CR513_23698, partial [Mucuna pruriens]